MTDRPAPAPGPQAASPRRGWFQRFGALLFAVFCLEIGLFLLVYPWTEGWMGNYFAWAVPDALQTPWHAFWSNSYARGAVSGLGVVDVWIALIEVFRVFSRSPEPRNGIDETH